MILLTQKCPVCKARLYKTGLPGKVRCPRCGAEFRPTVPLLYFQVLLVLFLVVCSLLVIDWSSRSFWPFVIFGVLLILFLGLLSRFARMEIDPTKIPIAGGVGPEDIPYKLPYDDWDEPEQGVRPGLFLVLLCVLLAVVVVLVVLKFPL